MTVAAKLSTRCAKDKSRRLAASEKVRALGLGLHSNEKSSRNDRFVGPGWSRASLPVYQEVLRWRDEFRLRRTTQRSW